MIDTDVIRVLVDSTVGVKRNQIVALCNEIDRLRGEKQTPPQGKTVRAEIKVAVDYNGNIAVGEDNFQWILRPRAYYTLTADLLVPEEIEVKAEICYE